MLLDADALGVRPHACCCTLAAHGTTEYLSSCVFAPEASCRVLNPAGVAQSALHDVPAAAEVRQLRVLLKCIDGMLRSSASVPAGQSLSALAAARVLVNKSL